MRTCDSRQELVRALEGDRAPDAILVRVDAAGSALESMVDLFDQDEGPEPVPLIAIGASGSAATARSMLLKGAQDYIAENDLSAALLDRGIHACIEHVKSERARLEAEARYRILFEAAPAGIVLTDENGRIVGLNPFAERLLQYERQELLGKPVELIVPEESRERHERCRKNYQTSPLPTFGERPLKARRKDGSVIDVDLRLSPMVEDDKTLVIGSLIDISQRVRADAHLRENERRLQQAQRIAGLGYWERELPRNRFHLSAQMAAILGLPAEKVTLGLESTLKFVHPEERDELEAIARRLLRGSGPLESRFRILRTDGAVRTVISRAEVAERDGKRIIRLAGVLYDVSDQVRIEEALSESERRFRGAFHQAATGMVIYDRDGRFIQVNSSFGEMLGYPPDELAGRSILEVTHPDDVELSRELVADLAEGRTTELVTEKRYLRRNGRVVWGQVSASVLRVEGGAPFQFIAQIQDVTERKKGQEDLRREREKFARLFEISPLGITMSRLEDGELIEVNPAIARLLGYSREELVGRSALDLGVWRGEEDRLEMIRKIRQSGSIGPLELELRARNGKLIPVEVSIALMEVEGVEHLMSLVSDISERKAFQAELERQALYDPLTGLPNRILFRDRLEHALERVARNGGALGVIFIDLDRFKVVNDTFGHLVGDELLAAVARRLRGRMRQQDTFARLGGDEFAGLLEGVSGPQDVTPVVERIVAAFDRPFAVAGTEVKASASVGVTVSSESVQRADDLMRFSDMAMYEAKRGLGTHFHMFNSDEDSTETHRFRRETELWRALERQEFEIYYQPIVRLDGGEIIGAEALIRWRHPQEGLLLPAEFIPIAEESGLITPIEQWVVKTVLAQGARWIQMSGREDFLISSNLSARHLREADFVDDLNTALADAGLPSKNLELELTERMLLTSLSRINELRDLGVRIAVDDLGTGYSSLEYLITMHIDTLKVDRVIVEGLAKDARNAAVVEAALLIGRRLGLRVIAEGVEGDDQAKALRELGYKYGQGYLFFRPMPPRDLERLIL